MDRGSEAGRRAAGSGKSSVRCSVSDEAGVGERSGKLDEAQLMRELGQAF